jgi:hypothetical protein
MTQRVPNQPPVPDEALPNDEYGTPQKESDIRTVARWLFPGTAPFRMKPTWSSIGTC